MGHGPDESPSVEPQQCSFCNRAQNDVRALITGSTANICDDCVGTCVDMLADAVEGDPGLGQPDATDPSLGALLSCALCGLPVYSEEATLIPNRGAICAGCLDEVQAAAAEEEK